ncbi:MAG: hypothetical protein WBN16_07675 [Lutimonas sp.]
MDVFMQAHEFENRRFKFKTTSERILASREVKSIILSLNEEYKLKHDEQIMDLMKRLTVIKRKIEKRLNKVPKA